MAAPKGPADMMASMINNFPSKTGKSIDEWLKVFKDCNEEKHMQKVKWLKDKGMTHGFALIVVMKAKEIAEGGPKSPETLVNEQFSGDKEKLRPIYDKIVKGVANIAEDINILPRQTCVTLDCGKKFGTVQATTKYRLDLGLRIPDVELKGILKEAKNFDMNQMTCQMSFSSVDEVTDDVINYAKIAYENRKSN